MFQDRSLTCRDCAGEFTFSSGEQTFFCQQRTARTTPSDARPAGPSPSAPGPVGGPREFHAAICGSCGGQAMVPFAPRNDRPVYCSSCFDKVRAGTVTETPSPSEPRRALRVRHRAARPARAGRPRQFRRLDFRQPQAGGSRSHGRHHHPGDGRPEPELVERRGAPRRRDGLEDRSQHPDRRGREVDAPRSATARSSSTGSRSRSASSTRAETACRDHRLQRGETQSVLSSPGLGVPLAGID